MDDTVMISSILDVRRYLGYIGWFEYWIVVIVIYGTFGIAIYTKEILSKFSKKT